MIDIKELKTEIEKVPCMSRRAFILAGASVVTMTTLPGIAATFSVKKFPRQRIATLNDVRSGEAINFQYPQNDPYATNILVKLNEKAGHGVGKDDDIVAFNQLCTHMGGPLVGTYKKEHKVLGPCPLHLTTFDLTRHGIVVSGHATESLPQIMLEVVGNDIYAVGVMGLLYGHTSKN
jgi:arsenite oxidase small subunit